MCVPVHHFGVCGPDNKKWEDKACSWARKDDSTNLKVIKTDQKL